MQNARFLLSSCALCRSKSGPLKKIVMYWNAKNACASSPFFPHISTLCSSKRPAKKSDVCGVHSLPLFFPLISVRCAVLKDPPQKNVTSWNAKKTSALSFFSSYHYVVQFEKTHQKEWCIRSARFLSSYYLNAKMEGTDSWALLAKRSGASGSCQRLSEFEARWCQIFKKNKMQRKESKPWHNGFT